MLFSKPSVRVFSLSPPPVPESVLGCELQLASLHIVCEWKEKNGLLSQRKIFCVSLSSDSKNLRMVRTEWVHILEKDLLFNPYHLTVKISEQQEMNPMSRGKI